MVYFLKGSLPWQGLKASSHNSKSRLVLKKKQSTTVEDLCHGLPQAFTKYLREVRSLTPTDVPDYNRLRQEFRLLFRQQGFERDRIFDWTVVEFYRQQSGDPSMKT